MIICPICNKEMKCINHVHLNKHKMTVVEFKKQFPNFEMSSEEVKLKNKENSKKGVVVNKVLRKVKEEERRKEREEFFLLLKQKCKYCDKLLTYSKDRKIFCDHSCAAKYTNKNRTVVYSEKAKENHRKIGLKNFKFAHAKIKKAKVYNLICEICKTHFQVGAEQKTNRTCSMECRKKLYSKTNNRENNTYGKSGYYQGIYCASSWELAFLIYQKDLGKVIKRCDITFTYYLDNIAHTYFPDFLMDDVIYEIKGLDRGDVDIKTEAVINAGYEIKVIRRKEIEPMIKELKKKYQIKDLTSLYEQRNI